MRHFKQALQVINLSRETYTEQPPGQEFCRGRKTSRVEVNSLQDSAMSLSCEAEQMASRSLQITHRLLYRFDRPAASHRISNIGACRQPALRPRRLLEGQQAFQARSYRTSMAAGSLKQTEFGGEGFKPEGSGDEFDALRDIEVRPAQYMAEKKSLPDVMLLLLCLHVIDKSCFDVVIRTNSPAEQNLQFSHACSVDLAQFATLAPLIRKRSHFARFKDCLNQCSRQLLCNVKAASTSVVAFAGMANIQPGEGEGHRAVER